MKLARGYAERIYDEEMRNFGTVDYRIVTLDHSRIHFPRMLENREMTTTFVEDFSEAFA
jgi:hypothetical protein